MNDPMTGPDEIAQMIPASLPIDLESAFPRRKGFGVKKKNKARAELLIKAQPVLAKCLEETETIVDVSQAVANLWWEAYFLGWMSYYINTTTLVLTDRRLLMIHTDNKGHPRSFATAIPTSALKKVRAGSLFGFLGLKLSVGQFSFTRISKENAKRFLAKMPISQNPTGGRVHLCPSCFAIHEEHQVKCSRCQVKVKSPRVAAMRSLILPGLGDYYLGHRALAFLEMAGSLFGWLILGALFLGAITETNPEEKGAGWMLVGIFIGLLGIGHVVDMLLTRAQGKKGMYSLDGLLPTAPASGQM